MRLFVVAFVALLAACANSPAHEASGNVVVSRQSPRLTLEIDSRFNVLRTLRFPIENLTNVERRIFVEADDDRRVNRMIIVQFEKVIAGSGFRFLYPSRPPRVFGAETYRYGIFAYDDARAAERDPAREAGMTRSHLRAAGFTPARLYRVARLARVTDPQGLSEVIIFYMENADASPPTSQPDEDGDYALSDDEQQLLMHRMEASIRALDG